MILQEVMKKKTILGTSNTESFVPVNQQTSVLHCRLSDFKNLFIEIEKNHEWA